MVETAAEQFLMELARTEKLEQNGDCGECPLFMFCSLGGFDECDKAYEAFQEMIYDVGKQADRLLKEKG